MLESCFLKPVSCILQQLRPYILVIVLSLTGFSPLYAQQVDTTAVQPDSTLIRSDSLITAPDSAAILPDSVSVLPDSLRQTLPNLSDSLRQGLPGDTARAAAPGLQAPAGTGALKEGVVYFQSKDSLVFNFEEDRIATLYGSAEVLNKSGKLESGEVNMNLDDHVVSAYTSNPQDTLSQPVLTREGQDPLRSKRIAFNYVTEKGRFEVARVTIPKGKITGTVVKKVAPHVIFIKDAIFSTCPLPHPHYYIKADKAKIVDQEEIFFEDARLYILDIPYPLVFPFGWLPRSLKRRQSGLLQPTYVYQNAGSRGIGLRNVGWFQYFNDYIVGQASVDIYTSGTFYLDASTDYRVRDAFSGGIQIGYSFERGPEPTDPDYSETIQKKLSINHNQQFSPYSTLTANILLRTADFYRRNSYDIDDRVQTSTSSNISYRYRQPNDWFNFNTSIRQSRNFLNNTTTLSGPSFNFNLKRLSPFADESDQDRRWYENISIQYDNSFESNFRYQPINADSAEINWVEALFNPDKYRKATGNNNHYRFGFQQDLRVSFGNLWPGRFINLTANADYTEFWVPATIRKTFDADSNEAVTQKVRGFTAAREYSTSLNMSTTIYGISNTNIGNITGFRHTIRPTISFSYRPDFSSNAFGYFRTVQVDTTGTGRFDRYSIFENAVFGGPSGGEQRSINFGISNTLEAKVVERDSTGEKNERILQIIDRLSLSSSYNFAADSLKLSNLRMSFTSSIIEGVNIRASANFNFYERNELGTKIDEFLFKNGGFMELTDFSVSASTRFSGGKQGGIRMHQEPFFPAHYDPLNQSIFEPMDARFNSMPIEPFNTPWSVSINFRYSWRLNPNGKARKTATINARQIQFQLTPKWDFSTQLGYDFIRKEFTPSKFRLTRKLHMWNLSFEMSPFGEFQYYFFRLSINSSALQSIFQKLPLLNNLERSSSPTGAGIRGYR